MVPSFRLLWLVVLVPFPVAVVSALISGTSLVSWLVITVCAIVAILDAVLGRVALDGIDLPTFPASQPVRMYKGREATFRMLLNNQSSKLKRLRIALDFPESFERKEDEQFIQLPALPSSYAIEWTLTAQRRGRYFLDRCYLETGSPLGLWKKRVEKPIHLEILVYPNLRTPAGLLALRKGLAGVHAQRQVGQGREFEKLREYAPGDAYDQIHWKATARRAKPVTKIYQVERTQEIYVILDSSRLSQRPIDGESVLEHYITAGLLLGAAAESNGDLFGLAAFSDKIHGFVRARNGKAHYAACRDAIYQIHPNLVSPDFEEMATFLRMRLRRRAMLIFLTQLDDPVIAESFARATRMLGKQHLILAGVLSPNSLSPLFSRDDAATVDDVYARLASHTAWRGLEQTQIELRRQGVRLTLLEPGTAVEQLVKLYGNAKQRQLL